MTEELLTVRGVTKAFGGLVAVSNVMFSVQLGEIFGIIGPNGAGKTTLFNVIAGHYRATAGSIHFQGRKITGLTSDKIGRLGISRTFQAVHLFRQETVAENLRRAAVLAQLNNPLSYFWTREVARVADTTEVAEFLGLGLALNNVAGSLPYGQQKLLGVGMALMTAPKLLLMDEPVAGLNPSEKRAARALIQKLRDERGISILLVEHDMPLVMNVCDRILVVNHGQPIALDTPEKIKTDSAVIDAYLGEEYEFA